MTASPKPEAGPKPGILERDRKAEHIRLAMDPGMQLEGHYLDGFVFEHVALPELNLADVDTCVRFLGKPLKAPLLISCMTGGTPEAETINRRLAEAAEAAGVALGVGSQRKALEDPAQARTFQVRREAPNVPLLANLGAVQLNYGMGVDQCRAAVDMIEADALVLHLNPLQEAIQPEGQCDFSGLLPKIAEVVEKLPVPVIVKEVGSGISGAVARRLMDAGVRIVDTAGLGGTSWARIEARRAGDVEIGEVFADWGIPTPECLQQLRELEGLTVIGSGGLRNGLDAAKTLALGAHLAGMAFPFLKPATESARRVEATLARVVRELRIAMFCLGAPNIETLRRTPLRRRF